ncbi:MAG: hypothetical protein WB014_04635 [Methanosarcina sp.]
MSDVRVHYNSGKLVKVRALAYYLRDKYYVTDRTDICPIGMECIWFSRLRVADDELEHKQ